MLAAPDAKSLLLRDVKEEHPSWLLAYSRPGLTTWKCQGESEDEPVEVGSVFSRLAGRSLGRASSIEDVLALAERFPHRCRLHVFERDDGKAEPQKDPARFSSLRAALLAARPSQFYRDEKAQGGEWVLDVILGPSSESDEAWVVGLHRQDPHGSRLPGAVARCVQPAHAPARAYCKLEELIAWASLPVKRGQTAVEIGCAPGGAVVSLLDRGVTVTGIDPSAMDPRTYTRATERGVQFSHLRCPIGAVKREQLPPRVDWLLCDANLAPQVALRYLSRWARLLRPHLRGVIFTMKLNDDRVVSALPRILEGVGRLGLGAARAVQLPSHRRELVALVHR